MTDKNSKAKDSLYEGRDKMFMDIDRMTNEGLGGGYIATKNVNGSIEESTVDTMNIPE
ncbi:hypothetical protein [Tepidibacillus marianensis]|uniref:hypothetical protein n=1 Tax=Tepidibacillus marianensis TaxID=3131995 RepID=UPI0030D5887C